jgi:hypothetical protein
MKCASGPQIRGMCTESAKNAVSRASVKLHFSEDHEAQLESYQQNYWLKMTPLSDLPRGSVV